MSNDSQTLPTLPPLPSFGNSDSQNDTDSMQIISSDQDALLLNNQTQQGLPKLANELPEISQPIQQISQYSEMTQSSLNPGNMNNSTLDVPSNSFDSAQLNPDVSQLPNVLSLPSQVLDNNQQLQTNKTEVIQTNTFSSKPTIENNTANAREIPELTPRSINAPTVNEVTSINNKTSSAYYVLVSFLGFILVILLGFIGYLIFQLVNLPT